MIGNSLSGATIFGSVRTALADDNASKDKNKRGWKIASKTLYSYFIVK